MSLPERINVIRTVTYHVPTIIQDMNVSNGDWEPRSVDEVIEFISDWVEEDLRAPISRHDLVYQDENGDEL
jgi:hypothetical protein